MVERTHDLRPVFEVRRGSERELMDLCLATCFTGTLPFSVTPDHLRFIQNFFFLILFIQKLTARYNSPFSFCTYSCDSLDSSPGCSLYAFILSSSSPSPLLSLHHVGKEAVLLMRRPVSVFLRVVHEERSLTTPHGCVMCHL